MTGRLSHRSVLIALTAFPFAGLAACDGDDGTKKTAAGHEPAIPFAAARVEQGATPGTFDVTWSAPGVRSVTVYAGLNPSSVGRQREVGKGGTDGRLSLSGFDNAGRWYFELVPDRGASLVLADRSLHLSGAPNFRDIGGYRTADGHWVEMGLVYRSDPLVALTAQDLESLAELHIKLVCDLRTEPERAAAPDTMPEVDTFHAGIALGSDELNANLGAALADPRQAEAVLGDGKAKSLHLELLSDVLSPAASAAYNAILTRIADPAYRPTVFHCAGGEHRTGWGAFVLLTILGVPYETAVQDYVASATYREGITQQVLEAGRQRGLDPSLIEPLIGVSAEDIAVLQQTAIERYGSFDAYVADGPNLSPSTLEQLRHGLLAG